MSKSYSFEIFLESPDGKRYACKDGYKTHKSALKAANIELKRLPDLDKYYYAVVYRRYAYGEWGNSTTYRNNRNYTFVKYTPKLSLDFIWAKPKDKKLFHEAHIKVWNFVIDHIKKGSKKAIHELKKEAFDVLFDYDIDCDEVVPNNCLGCAWGMSECQDCLFKIKNSDADCCLNGVYNKLYLTPFSNKSLRIKLATQIRDFPIKKK